MLFRSLAELGVEHFTNDEARAKNAFTRNKHGKSIAISIVFNYDQSQSLVVDLARHINDGLTTKPKYVMVYNRFEQARDRPYAQSFYDAYIATSKCVRHDVEQHQRNNPDKPFWVIPGSLEDKNCHPQYKASPSWMFNWLQLYPNFEQEFSICVPCNISPLHGLEDLTPIISSLRAQAIPAQAYITGDCAQADASYLSQLHNLYREAGIEPYINWVGPRSDMRDLLSVSSVCINLCNKPISYARGIYEMLYLGGSGAGYNHGFVGELIEQFLSEGLIEPQQHQDMVKLLSKWHREPPQRITEVPYPYRMQDCVDNVYKLIRQLLD